jgi:glycosyltransferase involved in cell wall biosynthesis
MKKLLIITDMYPYDSNPVAGVFVQHQARYLSAYYLVKVVATRFADSSMIEVSMDKGSEITRVGFRQLKFFPLNTFRYILKVLPLVRGILRDWKPDIVHVHDCRHIPELFALRRVLVGFLGRKFLTAHNCKTLPGLAETKLHALAYRSTVRAAYSFWTHIFFVNERLRQALGQYMTIPYSSVIGNALPETLEQEVPDELLEWLSPGSFNIISAGNLVPAKGFDILTEAVVNIVKQGIRVRLTIVGEGPDRPSLEKQIKAVGMNGVIRLTGAIRNDVLRSYYQHFDAFALPSYSETFGIVYLEAMYSGIPVVGVLGQGIDGIIEDRVSGLLVKPKQVSDLEDKLLWLIDHPDDRVKMALAGKQLVEENYMMDSLIAKLRAEYEA